MFPSETLGCHTFPIELHGLLPDVPILMVVHVLHFKPKWQSHPDSWSPLSTVAIAVLGYRLLKRNGKYISIRLKETYRSSYIDYILYWLSPSNLNNMYQVMGPDILKSPATQFCNIWPFEIFEYQPLDRFYGNKSCVLFVNRGQTQWLGDNLPTKTIKFLQQAPSLCLDMQ